MTTTHLACDSNYRVLATADSDAQAQSIGVRIAVNSGRTCQVVELGTADVATLALIAKADCPALSRGASGDLAWLGGGIHPAKPYLEAMLTMHGVETLEDAQRFKVWGNDDGQRIVLTFLSNAATWKGETARTVKARLKEIVKR